jgi:hypothetical protein
MIAEMTGTVHRLQRRLQLAQLSGGLSVSSARKSRYAGPFQISGKDCCPAWPRIVVVAMLRKRSDMHGRARHSL